MKKDMGMSNGIWKVSREVETENWRWYTERNPLSCNRLF